LGEVSYKGQEEIREWKKNNSEDEKRLQAGGNECSGKREAMYTRENKETSSKRSSFIQLLPERANAGETGRWFAKGVNTARKLKNVGQLKRKKTYRVRIGGRDTGYPSPSSEEKCAARNSLRKKECSCKQVVGRKRRLT